MHSTYTRWTVFSYRGEDPLVPWLAYIKWTEDTYGMFIVLGQLVKRRCMEYVCKQKVGIHTSVSG